MRVVVIVLMVLAVVACVVFSTRGPAPAPADQTVRVSATIFPLADWLREIGGPDIRVHLLISGGANPHHYEPTLTDATALTNSRVLFAVGLGLDPWAGRLSKNAGVPCIETSSWILPRKLTSAERDDHDAAAGPEHAGHAHGDADPHFWLDPQRAIIVVRKLAGELARLQPSHAEAFARRAEAYVAKLQALDAEIEGAATAIPPGAQLVVFHDAYGYLLERLRIKLAAVVQSSPGVEPSTRDVSDAVRRMREIGQRTVFSEPASSPRVADLIAQEIGAQREVLDPMDSELGAGGQSYIERLRYDVQVLVKAARK